MTRHNINTARIKHHALKNRFFIIVVAIGTYGMLWFGNAYIFFQGICKRLATRSTRGAQLCELILLALGVSCFKLSHLFFKFTYFLSHSCYQGPWNMSQLLASG